MTVLCHYLNLDVAGGVENLFVEYLQADLSDLRHRLFVPSGRVHPLFTFKLSDMRISAAKKLGKLPLPKKPSFFRFWKIAAAIKRINPDRVIFWNGICPENWRGIGKRTYFYYDHGASWSVKVDKESSDFLKGAEQILCCSFAAKRMLELRWGIKNNVRHIPNPLRSGIRIAELGKSFQGNRPLVLGIAGRLISLKGMPLAIHALARIRKQKDAELRIAGEGPEMGFLKLLAKRLGVEKYVQFCGCVPDMLSFFKSVDVVLCPSLRESFGLTALEAMACGCPVVCSKIDGLPEIVKHNETGICLQPDLSLTEYEKLGGNTFDVPDCIYDSSNDSLVLPKAVSPEALALAVHSITEDADVYSTMSCSAIERVRDDFCLSSYCNMLAGAFSAIKPV